MHKLWVIARHEYAKIARKRSFVLGTVGIPLFFVVIIGLGIFVALSTADHRPLGYVDQAGVLRAVRTPIARQGSEQPVKMVSYADETAARAALEARQIQAYYVLPPDYLSSHVVKLYYWDKALDSSIQRDFDDFVRANLAASLPADVATRAREGAELTARSADGGQEISGKGLVNFLVPFFIGLFFVMVVMNAGNYLLAAITDEKENRTIEVMTTSVTPGQLIGGKALGLIAVALTQIAILFVVVAVTLVIGAQFLEPLRQMRVPWSMFLTMTLFFLPTFALIAGMMIAIGSMVTETRQGQQIAGTLNLLFTLPFFFIVVFFTAPNSTLATMLTLFPTTAFLTIALRWTLTAIPVWELVVSWSLLVVSGVAMVWAASRVFRVGMLRYGQRLDFRSMLRAVRTGAEG